jgi:hypothetical protein
MLCSWLAPYLGTIGGLDAYEVYVVASQGGAGADIP